MKYDNANGVSNKKVVSRKGYVTDPYKETRPAPPARNVQDGFNRGASVSKGNLASPIPLTSNTPAA